MSRSRKQFPVRGRLDLAAVAIICADVGHLLPHRARAEHNAPRADLPAPRRWAMRRRRVTRCDAASSAAHRPSLPRSVQCSRERLAARDPGHGPRSGAFHAAPVMSSAVVVTVDLGHRHKPHPLSVREPGGTNARSQGRSPRPAGGGVREDPAPVSQPRQRAHRRRRSGRARRVPRLRAGGQRGATPTAGLTRTSISSPAWLGRGQASSSNHGRPAVAAVRAAPGL
jgi:hypothetical protein